MNLEDSDIRKSWMMRSKRARTSKSGEAKTESINSAEFSFVIRTGYDRNKNPATGLILICANVGFGV